MNLTNIMGAAAGAVAPNAPPTNQWTTQPFQCDAAAPKEHWAKAVLCWPCVAAYSKSTADKSHVAFNILCFTPLGAYNSVRLSYGIMGDCGKDLLYGALCGPCGTRQAFTETEQLGAGPIAVNYGGDTETWSVPLCLCEPMSCLRATFCPCIVAHEIRSLLLPSSKDKPWFNYLCIIPMSMYGQTRHVAGIKSEWPHPVLEDLCVGCIMYPWALQRANTQALAWRAKQAGAAVGNAVDAAKKKAADAKNAIGKFMK